MRNTQKTTKKKRKKRTFWEVSVEDLDTKTKTQFRNLVRGGKLACAMHVIRETNKKSMRKMEAEERDLKGTKRERERERGGEREDTTTPTNF
jgi:hypothetical protein